jgi:hypothetical protein
MRLLILFFILFAEKLSAQMTSGARFMAMANAGTALEDVYSVGSNQAGIASLIKAELALTFKEHNYSFNELSIAAYSAFPTYIGVLGVFASNHSLKQDFNEFKGGLTLSRFLVSNFAIAGTLSYHQLSILEHGINNVLSFDLGLQYRLSQSLLLGIHLINPFAYVGIENSQYKVPAQVRIGASYIFSSQILLAIDSEYDLEDFYDFRLGLEYSVVNMLKIRGGTSLAPFKQYVGVGVNLNKVSIDGATSFHPQLGMSSQLSLKYEF